MRRTAAVLVPVMLVLAAAPASAGGSWLTVDPERSVGAGNLGAGVWGGWAGVGASVVMDGGICLGQGDDPASRATWSVFLHPSDAQEPKILVGTATAEERPASTSCSWDLVARFTVPDVPAGEYIAVVCDEACQRFPGDLIGGYLVVGPTSAHARYFAVVGDLRQQMQQQQGTLDQRADKLQRLERELRQATASLEELQERADRLSSQRDAAIAEREALRAAAAERASDATGPWRIATAVAVGLLLVTWLAVWSRRRHTVRIRVPDTVEELLEHSPRDRP